MPPRDLDDAEQGERVEEYGVTRAGVTRAAVRESRRATLAYRVHLGALHAREAAFVEQKASGPRVERDLGSSESSRGFRRRERAQHAVDKRFGAGPTTEHGGLRSERRGHVAFDADDAHVDAKHSREQPVGMRAKDRPELVLGELPVRDQRRDGVPAKAGHAPPQRVTDFLAKAAARDEE